MRTVHSRTVSLLCSFPGWPVPTAHRWRSSLHFPHERISEEDAAEEGNANRFTLEDIEVKGGLPFLDAQGSQSLTYR
jgi:hypothetical protein